MPISITKPTIGGSEDSWGDQINTALDAIVDRVNGVGGGIDLDAVTADASEVNILDGATATTAEINLLDGATANTVVNSKAVVYGAAGQVTAGELTATTANVTTVDLGNWTVTESSGVLYFATGGVNKAKLDASGNFTVTGDITAFGTI